MERLGVGLDLSVLVFGQAVVVDVVNIQSLLCHYQDEVTLQCLLYGSAWLDVIDPVSTSRVTIFAYQYEE